MKGIWISGHQAEGYQENRISGNREQKAEDGIEILISKS
jgi:hypothetical protein